MTKNILLTGACGGMGLATAKELIKSGYEVYGLDIRPIDEFDHFHFFQTDITSEESIIKVFERIKSQIDSIDVIINMAGIYDLNSLVEMSEKDFKRIFDINVFGVYRINKIFLPLLSNPGKIIIITSELATLDPLPFTGIYAISKSALDKYAYSLRMELQLLGHKVIVIRPGAIDTGLLNVSTDRLNKFSETTTHYQYNAERFKEIVESVEAKKIPPEKIGKLICKILSKKKPKFEYSINRNPLLRMLNILPKRSQNRIIKRVISK